MITYPHDFPVPLIVVDEIDSTSSYLQSLCNNQNLEEYTTVAARFQTAGKGQRGNSWESAADKNLLFSFVIYPDFMEAKDQFLISQLVSLAVKEVLDSCLSGITIKWPNDIYWQERKIGGMLIENDWMGNNISRSIAGVGVNINQESFTSSAPNPVSLRQITGKQHRTPILLGSIMLCIKAYLNAIRTGNAASIINQYKKSLFRKDGFHRYKDKDGEFTARMINVESDGRLILEDDKQFKRSYMFKEVEYLLNLENELEF